MIYSIAIYGSPYGNPSSLTALRFSEALLASEHQLLRVFFYHDAVHTASLLATPPQDESSLYDGWRQLAEKHNLDLVICVAAALKRGILDEQEAGRWNKLSHNLGPAFTLSGLGQLIDATIKADRHISFGA
ncbi:tRNA 2-thiouridine synthesizing protein D [Sinobacterium caligoides]|uniref:tRNA 2-thiouridine synthesizing protein D n=1 Tax=Sinobacterium caligoides TaxID=933926 RepID=A0A3N2DJT7_9GAMM|nr:sulfurtransferase complex subunit TusD [Sinobacterium caligoides]ROS00074.1 tRNA 2-thiouridine synthesizing protein D [Sinobacterium caligoides]